MVINFFRKIFQQNPSLEEYAAWLNHGQNTSNITQEPSKWMFLNSFSERKTYSLAIGYAFLGSLFYLGFAWVVSEFAAQWLAKGTSNHNLLLCAALFLGGRYFFSYLYSALCFKAGTTIISRLKNQIYQSLLHNNHLDSVESSTLVTNVCDDLKPFYSSFIPNAVNSILVGLMLIIVGFAIDFWMGTILLISFAIIPVLMIIVGIGAETVHAQHINLFVRYSAVFYNRLQTIAEILNLDSWDTQYQFLSDKSQKLNQASLKVMRVAVLSSAVLELFVSIAIAGVAIYFGMNLLGIMIGKNYGQGYDFQPALFGLTITPYAFYYLRKFVSAYHDKNRALAASQWLIPLLNSAPTLETPIPKVNFTNIEIQNLSFSYPKSSAKVLSNINIRLPNCGLVLIKGISGSGKSTLLKILSGIVTIKEGSLSVNGLDTTRSNLWLKENSSFLNQTPFIFDDTLAYNVFLIHQPQVNYPQFLNAILKQKPEGWQTTLTHNGQQLSGGEKQLIALARLMLHPKPVVVLDEPTANLDSNTTQIIINEIAALAETKLVIVASHDLQFEKFASVVVELNWGEQVEHE